MAPFLVKMALRCDSAEELGRKLKRRYDWQQRRQGVTGCSPKAEAELAAQLDKL